MSDDCLPRCQGIRTPVKKVLISSIRRPSTYASSTCALRLNKATVSRCSMPITLHEEVAYEAVRHISVKSTPHMMLETNFKDEPAYE